MYTPANVIASIFGLSAFAVATLAGLFAGANATDTVWRALVAMILFHIVGVMIGSKVETIARSVPDAASENPKAGGKLVENSGDRVNHDG